VPIAPTSALPPLSLSTPSTPTPAAPPPAIFATGADAGGGPLVNVYDGRTAALLMSFYALPAGFTGGVRVALGDVNADGVPDIVCAAGPGGGPEVIVFDGRTFAPLTSYYAFVPQFTGGVYVAAGDVNGDGHCDIIAGADRGGGPEVKVFSGADGT